MDDPGGRAVDHYSELSKAAAELEKLQPGFIEEYARTLRGKLHRLKMKSPRQRETRP